MKQTLTQEQVDARLDGVLIKQLTWKTGPARSIGVAVVQHFLRCPDAFTDDVDLSFVQPTDKMCIGSVWRNLRNRGILNQTNDHHRSRLPLCNGRFVFRYTLRSRALAERFVRINGAEAFTGQQQLL